MRTSPTGSRCPARAAAGFTLLELLVVLVIISVSAALIGPRVAGSLGGANLRTAAQRTAASLRFARSQAGWEGVPYVAFFDLRDHRMAVLAGRRKTPGAAEAPPEPFDPLAEDVESMIYPLPEGVRFESAREPGGEVETALFRMVFYPNGSSTGGTVVLARDRDRRLAVAVDIITGMVRLTSDASG